MQMLLMAVDEYQFLCHSEMSRITAPWQAPHARAQGVANCETFLRLVCGDGYGFKRS